MQKKHLYVPLGDHIIRLSTQLQHVGALFSCFMRITWHPPCPKLPVALNVQTGLAISIDLASLSSTAPFLPAEVGCPHKDDSLNIYLMRLPPSPPPLACPSSNSLSLAPSRSFARPAQTRLAAPSTSSTSTSCASHILCPLPSFTPPYSVKTFKHRACLSTTGWPPPQGRCAQHLPHAPAGARLEPGAHHTPHQGVRGQPGSSRAG